jgi:hypothetical protein
VKRINIVDAYSCRVQVEATGKDTIADLLATLVHEAPAAEETPAAEGSARLTFGGRHIGSQTTLRAAGIEDDATLTLLGAGVPTGSGPWRTQHHPLALLSNARASVPQRDEYNKELSHFHWCGYRRYDHDWRCRQV